MKKTIALAALLAATAFTPALAQDAATAAEPTPVPERVMVQMAQNERSERERGPRGGGSSGGGGERPQWNGGGGGGNGEGRAQGGWQRQQQQSAPVQQSAPAPQVAPAAPAERQWNRANTGGGQGWQGRSRQDWSGRAARPEGQASQPGWSRQAPQATAPVQPQTNWQNREQRRDTWANGSTAPGGGVQAQERGGWNGQARTGQWDGQRDGQRRNDSWQNNRRDESRDRGQWDGNRGRDGSRTEGRNDTWRDNGRNNGRNDTWRTNGRNNNRYDQRSQWQNEYRGWNRSWSRDWRRDQRYDWQRYRYSNRSLFQGDRYYAPYGWDYGYRRFSIGFSLSYLLYDQQYWIDDPYSYRLPPVYGPYRWVRYYDDVLLVDLRTGQVIDAIHDFFW